MTYFGKCPRCETPFQVRAPRKCGRTRNALFGRTHTCEVCLTFLVIGRSDDNEPFLIRVRVPPEKQPEPPKPCPHGVYRGIWGPYCGPCNEKDGAKLAVKLKDIDLKTLVKDVNLRVGAKYKPKRKR